jgi:hypothetical protein
MTENETANDAKTSNPNVPSGKSAPESVEFPKDVNQWFSMLSADDRAGALGFVDGPMFSVFSKVASSSGFPPFPKNPSGGQQTTDEPLIQGQYQFYGGAFSTLNSFLQRLDSPEARLCAHLVFFVFVVEATFTTCVSHQHDLFF